MSGVLNTGSWRLLFLWQLKLRKKVKKKRLYLKFCSNNMKGAGLCCLSTPGRLLNKILQKKKKVCVWPHWLLSTSLSHSDELFQQVKASESPGSISILASSSVSAVTASWGKGIIEIRPPPALRLWPSQPSHPSQLLEPPSASQSSPPGTQRAKRHRGPL